MTPNSEKNTLAEEKLNFLLSLPWMKIFTWGLFLLTVYAVRSFFTVIFLTFLLTYIAANTVNRLAPRLGAWEWLRKVLVLVAFAIFFGVSYTGGNFIIPEIVRQGQLVVKTVQSFGLDRGIHKILPDLVARWKYVGYKKTPEFDVEFQTFCRTQNATQLTREAFRAQAKKLRDEFRLQQAASFGLQRWEAARSTAEYEAAYREWLEGKVAEELYLPDEKRARLDAAKEAALISVMGQSAFEILKRGYGENYAAYLKSQIVKELVAGLERERQDSYHRVFQEKFIEEQGEKAVAEAEKTPAWEERFREFYAGCRKTRGKDVPYEYEKFAELEAAPDDQKFVALLGAEQAKAEERALAQKFEAETLNRFSEETSRGLNEAGIFNYVNDAAGAILGRLLAWLQEGIASLVSFTFDVILSVFLSFVIMWDLPRLARGVGRLEQSRLHRLYNDLVPGLASFGLLLGQSFVARALIALVNVALILATLVFMGVEQRMFLCTMVFICSFIPIVGVVISGVPIVLVALQVGGHVLALKLVAALTIITIVESLLLDPKIMGDVLNLHTLVVLIVLTLGGHYFGVWGLLLGVPIAVFVIRDVILREGPRQQAAAAPGGASPPAPGR
jgi:predicted PurR-regulated permease PerM